MSNASPRPPRRRWPYLLAGLLVLLVTPIAYYGVLRIRTHNDWLLAAEETDALDPRWRLDQIHADLEPIPDDENLALATIRILAPGKIHVSMPPKRYEVLFPHDYPVNAEMNPDQVKFLRGSFQRIGNRIDDARELRKYTKGRFKLAISEDFFSTNLPDHQDVRILSEWLTYDARLLAQDEDLDNAIRSCESSLALGCAFRDDPFLISFLIRCAIYHNAAITLERSLAQGEASDTALLRGQKRALAEYRSLNWATAMRGERAGNHQFFEGVLAGRLSLAGWATMRGNNDGFFDAVNELTVKVAPGVYLSHYPDHLRRNTELVEIAKLAYHERKQRLEKVNRDTESTKNRVVRTFSTNQKSIQNAEGRTGGLLLSAAVAIACERYRLQHPQRDWPGTLEDVVKKGLLDEVPRDPIDNQPLRYRKTTEGIVVYSIGPDGNDDGGNVEHPGARNVGQQVDIGFRLWNVNLRRQRALPAPAEPEVPN